MTDYPTSSPVGADELLESLTGYEEREIENRFGLMPDSLLNTRPTMAMRGLVAIVVQRHLDESEVKDSKGKAFKHAMSLKLSEVDAFFPDDVDEVNPDEPVTPAGNGEGSDAD